LKHVGTSETRDFLLMLPIAADTTAKRLDKDALFKLSQEAAETTHPAMLSLLPAKGEAGSMPAMEHDEARELWSVRVAGKAAAAGKASEQMIQLVVVGKAAE
jgi:hypothetical protein